MERTSASAAICSECLVLCEEIIVEELGGLGELVQVLRQHPAPGVPLVRPSAGPSCPPGWGCPWRPAPRPSARLADVLPLALAGGQLHDPPLPEQVQLRALQARQELQRRGEVQVLAPGFVVEALDW